MGVCCPDDIALSGLAGSQIILDLPGGGEDYEDNDNTTGNLLYSRNGLQTEALPLLIIRKLYIIISIDIVKSLDIRYKKKPLYLLV